MHTVSFSDFHLKATRPVYCHNMIFEILKTLVWCGGVGVEGREDKLPEVLKILIYKHEFSIIFSPLFK